MGSGSSPACSSLSLPPLLGAACASPASADTYLVVFLRSAQVTRRGEPTWPSKRKPSSARSSTLQRRPRKRPSSARGRRRVLREEMRAHARRKIGWSIHISSLSSGSSQCGTRPACSNSALRLSSSALRLAASTELASVPRSALPRQVRRTSQASFLSLQAVVSDNEIGATQP